MSDVMVVDCSVAAKWVLPEPDRAPAMRLLERYEAGEISLIAPDLLLAEFASLLARRTRRKQISQGQAREALQLMERCALLLFDMRPRLRRALDIALEHHLSLWDSIYAALAVEHDCLFVTADRRLFRSSVAWHAKVSLLA
jgi:predicted nucleic acid-binding protein